MAATKIFPITTTEHKSLSYIADPTKTDNRRLIITQGCSYDPIQASHDFEEMRHHGTGKSKVLSQHFIVSFAPGEITPEDALQVGAEICEQFLKGEYQYYMTCHTDKSHVHIHCIFNNTNSFDGKTFETHENRRITKADRSYQKLINITDEICRQHSLSVIENPEQHKGKSHWEWQINREGLSWKAKLKNAIDSIVEISDSFEDFLRRCAENGILVEYNPNHKIDLKYMLAEQREHNPRAKFTRAKTLGYFYETAQIKSRIEMRKGTITYTPKTQIRQTPNSDKFVQDAIARGNMKVASIAKNILTQYGVSPENMRSVAMQAYAQRGKLSAELNRLQTEIEDSKAVLKVLKRYHKVKGIHAELKNLSGRKERKFREQNSYELQEYKEVSRQLLEWFPDKHLPKVDELEQKITTLMQERSEKNELYQSVSQKSKDLAKAQQTIEEYLRQEQRNQPQKKKNKGELE